MPQNDVTNLSVVIPLCDDSPIVAPLLTRLEAALSTLPGRYEVIAVDDGSRDDTWSRLVDLSPSRPWLRGIRLSRSFGHHPATLAGLRSARGSVILTSPPSLQFPPEAVPRLLTRLDEGFDLVFASPPPQGGGFLREKVGSAVCSFLSRFAEGAPPPGISTFLAARRELVMKALEIQVPRPVVPFHLMLAAPRASSLSLPEPARSAGAPKHGLLHLVQLTADILFGYTSLARPLLLAAAAAVPLGAALLWLAAAALNILHLPALSALLVVAGVLYALGSLALLLLVLAELLLRSSDASKPLYSIRASF